MSLLKTNSVDSIISAFTKTITKLDALRHAKQLEADRNRADAEVLRVQADIADTEADRAYDIASKLAAIVS